RILLERNGNSYMGYQLSGRTNYHFDADQLSISPYTQFEWQPLEWIRLTAGLRYDHFRIDYTDRQGVNVPEVGVFPPLPFPARHFRAGDQQVSFEQWSPKLGLVVDLHPQHNFYLSHRHAFRAPTAGQLFR